MQALTGDRLNRLINESRDKCNNLEPKKLAEIDETMALSFEEHFKFQELQARCHAQGILSLDAAQIVYNALGEVGSSNNGGWASGTDTATKVIVTQLMGEILQRRLAGSIK